ncbi:glycoside hydrolase domain-containing protein [Bacillus thuringiensis]|uniref:glycoside hydrolase domain-containing protein n=1 Tax=Bacillus thuringiensis TaxID=1428 RepID=UPI001F1F9503|nr:glycoside hydrolase domain-containing protein [Bacillus thuringiensis]
MDEMVKKAQEWVNSTYKGRAGYKEIEVTGKTGWSTMGALTQALQLELGITETSTSCGPTTLKELAKKCPISTTSNTNANIVKIIQAALYCKGYGPGGITGTYTPGTQTAIASMQKDLGATPSDGAVTPKLFKALLTMDAYVLVNNGSAKIRNIQQWLNSKYINRADFFYMPCDGHYSRDVQKSLMFAIQYEEGLQDGTANGNFGPTTQDKIKSVVLKEGSTGPFVYLFQASLIFNGYDVPFDGKFSTTVTTQLKKFQNFSLLKETGTSDYQTWASLLVSTGDPERQGKACDCITEITPERAKTLISAGYETVGRYLTNAKVTNAKNKKIQGGEMHNIFRAGLSIFPIYQTNGGDKNYFNASQGKGDAIDAFQAALNYGFPYGTTIYFAVDFDATDDDIKNKILPHFQAINEQMQKLGSYYKIGVYGSRNVCIQVSDKKYATYSFVSGMSTGFSGNLGFPLPKNWAFDQIKEYAIGSGNGSIAIDKDIKSGRDSGYKIFKEELNLYECIVVSAKEGNEGRYKYNFIETAIKKIRDLKQKYDNHKNHVTWIIEKSLYTTKDIENFKETATHWAVDVILVNNKNELINYINTQSINGTGKRLNKITDFSWFGHGHKGYVDFGPVYSPDGPNGGIKYKEHLHKEDIEHLQKDAFVKGGTTNFYSCNTGTNYEGNSFAQLWANKTETYTTACTDGQTDYQHITVCSKLDVLNWEKEWIASKENRAITGYSEYGSLRYPELGEVNKDNPNPHWVVFKSKA